MATVNHFWQSQTKVTSSYPWLYSLLLYPFDQQHNYMWLFWWLICTIPEFFLHNWLCLPSLPFNTCSISHRACDLCKFCRNGSYQYCLTAGINSTIGIFRDGGWAQYVRCPQDQVYALPDGITTKQGNINTVLWDWL